MCNYFRASENLTCAPITVGRISLQYIDKKLLNNRLILLILDKDFLISELK